MINTRVLSSLLLLALSSICLSAPSIEIIGVGGEIKDNVANAIDLSKHDCEIAQWRYPSLEQRNSAKAKTILRALGYYHPDIKAMVSKQNDCWNLSLQINPGERVVVKDVSITVNKEFEQTVEYQDFLKDLPLMAGDFLEHGKYEQIKQTLSAIATRNGYFNSYFATRKLKVKSKMNQAWITIDFNAGNRFRYGKVSINKTGLNKHLFDQYLIIQEGMLYSSDLLTRQQLTLINSQHFKTVSVSTERENSKDKTIPVTINLVPRKKKAYRFGIGASTDIGPRVSLRFENRRASSRGNQLKSNLSLSESRHEVGISYTIPRGEAGKNRIGLSAGFLSETTDTSDKKSWKLALLRTRLLSSGWVGTQFIEYLGEDFETADGNHLVKLLMPGYQIQKTRADDPVFPRNGWRINARFQFAEENFLSDISLLRLTTGLKVILPFTDGRILLRSNLGATETNDFNRTPASLRFFAGGDGSIRGFGYESLGPTNDRGEVIGGKFLTSNSLEFEYPVRESWGIAVFSDFGNAFNDFNNFKFRSSVGFGVRWHSPLGPIRFDLAQDFENNEGVRFHLSMGPDL